MSLHPAAVTGRGLDALGLARSAIRRLLHRGPDGYGAAGDGISAVAMCRLRVRSRPADPVPFWSGQQATSFAYNGEVYAVGAGARDGATAVVVPSGGTAEAEAVAGHEPDCLDGMYAVVQRAPDGSIEVMRDPFGIKPLFLRRDPDGVVVSSELLPLLDLFGPVRVRPAAIAQFLLVGRVVDGGTFYEGIEAVPPGSRMLLKEGRTASLRTVAGSSTAPMEAVPSVGLLRTAVARAVDRVLVSDRPIGLALSGGLDSTLLALELARRDIEDLSTVSVIPESNGDGVRGLASLGLPGTAWQGWRHHWRIFGPTDLLDGIADAVSALGEPTAMTSAPMYAALARLARESGIVVLVLGEGADEIFGGYRSYLGLEALGHAEQFYLSPRRAALARALLGPDAYASARAALAAALPAAMGRPAAEVVREFEYKHSLEPLLRRADHLLMAEGVEGRTPFLHGGLPALGASFPMEELLQHGQTKTPLRQAYAEELPFYLEEVKRPFRAPVEAWVTGAQRSRVLAYLAGRRELFCAAGLRPQGVDELSRGVAAGDAGALGMVFTLLSLGAWLESTTPLRRAAGR